MKVFEDEDIKKIAHHIESLSTDMYQIRKSFEQKKKEEEILSKKDKKRRESLKKAQKKFKNISTNLKPDIYKKLEERVLELKTTKSDYIKNLILDDLGIEKR